MKQKEERKALNDSITEAYGMDFVELTKHLPDKTLLEVGKLIANTDYAVRFFKNERHSKFYQNREMLEKSVRHGWAFSNSFGGKRVVDYLVRNQSEILKNLHNEELKGVSESDGEDS